MRKKFVCMAAALAPAIFGYTLISTEAAFSDEMRGRVFLSRDDCRPLTMSNLDLCCSALNARSILSRKTRDELCPPQYTAAIGNDDDPGDDDNRGDDDDNRGDDDTGDDDTGDDDTGDDDTGDDDTGDDDTGDDDTGDDDGPGSGLGNPGNGKDVGRAGETPTGGGWNEPDGGPGSRGRSDGGNGRGGGRS